MPNTDTAGNSGDYQQDLNPDFVAGENRPEAQNRIDYEIASNIKELHGALPEFTNDELREISVVPDGARLLQGATYLDLGSGTRYEFTATAEQSAEPGHWYVPKSRTDYETWNRLRGVSGIERTGRA